MQNPTRTRAGAAPASNAYAMLPPGREGLVHHAEATSSHCFVTVDLDLGNGYVRFFRNGHLIGTAFQGLAGTVCPVLAFVQVGVRPPCWFLHPARAATPSRPRTPAQSCGVPTRLRMRWRRPSARFACCALPPPPCRAST